MWLQVIIILVIITFLSLWIAGLSIILKKISNLSDCGCYDTKIVDQGQSSININEGNKLIPIASGMSPSVTLIKLNMDHAINFNDSELNVAQLSIGLTIIFAIVLLVLLCYGAVKVFSSGMKMFLLYLIPLSLLYIFYLTSIAYLADRIFKIGKCECNITNILEPGSAGASVDYKGKTITIPSRTAQTSVTTINKSYRLINVNDNIINLFWASIMITFILLALIIAYALYVKFN